MKNNFEHADALESTEETKINRYGRGALSNLHDILEPLFGDGPFVIISDETIWKVTASYFSSFLDKRPETTLCILPGIPAPYASDAQVAQIREELKRVKAIPIAVGAGTINDIVKRAAFENGIRYVCVPTAPSVDGFTSFGAAITVSGFKTTLPCPPPLCVVAEEDIIVHAPPELIASGYGDIIAKFTGGADWIIADLMGIEKIDPFVWDLAQSAAVDIFPRSRSLRRGDRESIHILYKGLLSSGLAMQHYNDSRPASGTEHLLSHTWEMFHLQKDGQDISHGFKVALGTLIAAALMQELFGKDGSIGALLQHKGAWPCPDLLEYRMQLASSLIPSDHPMKSSVINTIRMKTPSKEERAERADVAFRRWSELSERILRQVPPFTLLKKRLQEASCPVEPHHIGLSRKNCIDSLRLASLIRRRYTVLDLLSELGVFDMAAEIVFSPRYFGEYTSD